MYPLTDQQRLFYVESSQTYEAWHQAKRQYDAHKYGMRWLLSKGNEYLVRLIDAKGNGKSIGRRMPETELIYQNFCAGKEMAESRFRSLSKRMAEQARLNKAAKIDRVHTVVGDILLALDDTDAYKDFRVVGTHAIFAYEAMAGVQCKQEMLASGDVDLMYDHRKNLAIVAKKLEPIGGLLGILKRVDKSFELMPDLKFRAANKDGFMVDLITPPRDIRNSQPIQFADTDLSAVEVPNLQWLANAPLERVIAISGNGVPVPFRVPDPRAFAIHKAWLSQQSDREPVKRVRDMNQAVLVVEIINNYLPNFPLKKEYLPWY